MSLVTGSEGDRRKLNKKLSLDADQSGAKRGKADKPVGIGPLPALPAILLLSFWWQCCYVGLNMVTRQRSAQDRNRSS